jgi:hypothetical protein
MALERNTGGRGDMMQSNLSSLEAIAGWWHPTVTSPDERDSLDCDAMPYSVDPPATVVWQLYKSDQLVRCEILQRTPQLVEVRCLTPGDKPFYQCYWGSHELALKDAEKQQQVLLADGAESVM